MLHQKGKIMLELAEQRLRLLQNLLNQSVTRAHTGEIIPLEMHYFQTFIVEQVQQCARSGTLLPATENLWQQHDAIKTLHV